MPAMGDVSRVLGMDVTRGRENGVNAISQKDYTENVVQRFGMKGGNPAYTPRTGPGLSRKKTEEKLLNEEEKRRYQAITGP